MAIIFNQKNKMFKLITEHTQYMFKIIGDKYLVHCYYGYKSNSLDLSCDVLALGFSPEISNTELQRFSLNDTPLEFAYFGTGDYRCSSLKVRGSNGDSCTMYTYTGYEIFKGKRKGDKTPFARETKDTETLAVFLKDETTGCVLTLYYTVYPSYDIITRYFTVENQGADDVKIQKAMPIPIYGAGGATYKLFRNLGMIDTYAHVLCSAGGMSAQFLYYRAFFKNLSWTYAEAAMMDGAGPFSIYFKVMFPQAKPIFGALFLTVWLASWNSYESTLLYLPNLPTLPVGIHCCYP